MEYLANYDQLLRETLGVHATAFIEDDKIEFGYQTILDNVSLLDETVLVQINELIVEAGHSVLKKKKPKNSGLKPTVMF